MQLPPMLSQLLGMLKQQGLAINGPKAGEPDDKLSVSPKEKVTPEIINALKVFKPQLVQLYGRKASPDVGTEPHGDILVGAPTVGEFSPHR